MRLIDADAFREHLLIGAEFADEDTLLTVLNTLDFEITIDPERLRPKGMYTAHEVAEIIADLFGDCCACNFNGIDEWLPEKCEVIDACPYPVGVACWEQYLKYRHCKSEMEGKEDG